MKERISRPLCNPPPSKRTRKMGAVSIEYGFSRPILLGAENDIVFKNSKTPIRQSSFVGRGAGGGDIFFQEKSLPLHILPLLPIP